MAEQVGQIEAGVVISLLMGWVAVGTHQMAIAQHENVGRLDDLALSTSSYRDNLTYPTQATMVAAEMRHQVH